MVHIDSVRLSLGFNVKWCPIIAVNFGPGTLPSDILQLVGPLEVSSRTICASAISHSKCNKYVIVMSPIVISNLTIDRSALASLLFSFLYNSRIFDVTPSGSGLCK